MKKITSVLVIGALLLGVLQSCKKSEQSHGVSTSIPLTDFSRSIINTGSDLKSTIYLTHTNFIHQERGKVETETYNNGREVKSFKVNRVWISTVKITDFSHVDIDPGTDELNGYVDNFQLFIQDNNLVGQPLLLAEGTKLGYLDLLEVDFYAYATTYPDFNLHLVSTFNADPGARSILIQADAGMSYDYVTKEMKK